MSPFTVSRAAAHEMLPACRLLFTDGAEQRRELLRAERDASGLFVARGAGGDLHAAALVQAIPGALGVAWPPRGDSRDTEDAATRAACDWLRSRGVKVCQAFASAREAASMAPLERAGFGHVTQLVMLQRKIDSARDCAIWQPLESPLTLCFHKPGSAQLFTQCLAATHEASLDCPELNALRTTEEILGGFCPPEPIPAKWYRVLALEGQNAVGVLLFDNGPEPTAREIAYLGVIPEARGRGFGGWLIRFAIGEAAREGDDTLTVSVDARNTPAMKLYTRHGFAEYDRREVWLASLVG